VPLVYERPSLYFSRVLQVLRNQSCLCFNYKLPFFTAKMFLPISSTEIAESHFRKSTAQFVDHSPKHVRPNQHTKCYLCRHKHTKTPEGLRARSTRSSRLGRMRSYSACGADWKFMKPVTNENRISGSFRKTRVGSNIRHPGTIKQGSQRCVALLVVVTPETPMMDLVVNCRSAQYTWYSAARGGATLRRRRI